MVAVVPFGSVVIATNVLVLSVPTIEDAVTPVSFMFDAAIFPVMAALPEPSFRVFVLAPQTPVTVLEALAVQDVPMLEVPEIVAGIWAAASVPLLTSLAAMLLLVSVCVSVVPTIVPAGAATLLVNVVELPAIGICPEVRPEIPLELALPTWLNNCQYVPSY